MPLDKIDPFRYKYVTVSMCAYEVLANAVPAIPSITTLAVRNRWFGVLFTAAIGLHFTVSKEKEK